MNKDNLSKIEKKETKRKILILTVIMLLLLISFKLFFDASAEFSTSAKNLTYKKTVGGVEKTITVYDALNELYGVSQSSGGGSSNSNTGNENKPSVPSSTGNGSISGDSTIINSNVTFNLAEVEAEEKSQIKDNYFSEALDVYVIDTTLINSDNQNVELSGEKVEIKFDIPSNMSEGDNIKVYEIVNGEKKLVDSKVENGKIIISTDHMGRYVVAKYKSDVVNSTNNNNINNPKTGDINVPLIIILISILSMVFVISLVYILKNNKNNKDK